MTKNLCIVNWVQNGMRIQKKKKNCTKNRNKKNQEKIQNMSKHLNKKQKKTKNKKL